jgi:transcriptional regulator with XRE-family HTH domain
MQGSLDERLRVERAKRGLSLAEASELLGINRHTLRDLELGRREPYGPTLRRIAEGYGIPLRELLALEEPSVPLAEARKGPDPNEWGEPATRTDPEAIRPGAGGRAHRQLIHDQVTVKDEATPRLEKVAQILLARDAGEISDPEADKKVGELYKPTDTAA